ncbi:hypothetical protein D9M68_710280 [compost metagenome]
MQPRPDLALAVDYRFQSLDRDGVQVVVLDVVFPCPYQFDRCPLRHGLRDDGGFVHEVGFGLATETAAQQQHIDFDVLRLEPQPRRHCIARRNRILDRGPHLGLATLDLHGGHRRFHRGMSQMRHVVLRNQAFGLRRPAPGLSDVALVAHYLA